MRRGLPFVALAAAFVLTACSTKAKLIPQGGDCLQATDCEDGFVCVPQKDGRRICDNDLSGVQATEDAAPSPRDGGVEDAVGSDAPTSDSAVEVDSAPPQDAGTPDTGSGTDAATD